MTQTADVPLDRAAILAGLPTEITGEVKDLHIYSELDSTNEWLLEQGGCGDVCLAEQQTAGRGRRGRVWQSLSHKNICFSLRWCFAAVPAHYGSLSLQVGLAVVRALQEVGLNGHGLKWPNDIYYDGRKLGGILLQTAQPLQEVVIGIGLNVNMRADDGEMIDQPWCSLAEILGADIDRNHLLALLLKHLLPALKVFPTLDEAQFAADWRQWDILRDREVQVHAAAKVFHGQVQGINEQGQLDVLLSSGKQQFFSSADVSVRW